MNDLDLLDKKIILELDKNSRITSLRLAKKLSTSQQVISYRINRLLEKGVIKAFVTSFSTKALEIPVIAKLYIQFKGLNEISEKSIFLYLKNHKKVNWIAKTLGDYDLFIAVMVKDLEEFSMFKDSFFYKYGKYINEYEVSFIQKAYTLPRNYLIDKSNDPLKPAKIHGEVIKIKDIDKRILKEISNNSRKNVVDIAQKLKINVKTIMAKIKEFEKKGIIQGYRINLDIKKISMKYYKVFIKLGAYNKDKLEELRKYCLNLKYLIHFIENIGKYEIELEMEIPDSKELYELIKNMRNVYSGLIEEIKTVEVIDEVKLSWLPDDF